MTTSTTAEVAVRIRGLVKNYAGTAAVDGLDLDIATGEVFALLGPNGAGKTTTVEILEGYRHRDGGEVAVLGQDPATAGRAWRSRLGIVLQTSAEAAELTVEEMVRHFARYYPAPRDPDQVIDAVGLQERRTARLRALSGGQRRLLVALAMVGRPRLVVLDEPTTGLDVQARDALWAALRSYRASGGTLLITSHYLAEIDEGRSPNVAAPELAKRYWGLADDATLRDVVEVVRADEAHHRDVNHGFANQLANLPQGAVAPCPPHIELQPTWKTAA